MPELTDREFLTFWHFTVRQFHHDVETVEYLAARQWESLAIATYVFGPQRGAAR